jgi:redox-sensitive bicupin YhaK (pirin superfamily)
MEIISYVLKGRLEHRDSLGNTAIIGAGELQRMTAGTGVRHSEYNASGTEDARLLQLWIIPDTEGLAPSYEQKSIAVPENRLLGVGGRDGGERAIRIHADVELYLGRLNADADLWHPLKASRYAWLQMIRGIADLGGERVREGDGAAYIGEMAVSLKAVTDIEVLILDLA